GSGVSHRGRLLSSQSGVVEAPLADVLRLMPGAAGAGPGATLGTTPDPRTFCVTGGWWYRGEYELREYPRGTLLTYRVLDVARRLRWMVPLVLLQYRLSGQLRSMYDASP